MTRVIIYQQIAEPVTVPTAAPTTSVDRYLQPFSEPVRKPIVAAALALAFVISPFALTQKEAVSIDKWQQPLSDPVRPKSWHANQTSFVKSLSTQFAETTTVDRYYIPLSEPVRTRFLATALQPSFTISPFGLTQPESTSADKWYANLSEPVRTRLFNVALQQSNVLDVQPRPPALDYFQTLSEPVRTRWFGAALQKDFAVSPFGLTQPEQILVAKWLNPLSEPVRVAPRLLAGANQFKVDSPYFLPPEIITPDKWYMGLSEPQRQKLGLRVELQLTSAISAWGMTQPEATTVSRWYSPLSDPTRPKTTPAVVPQPVLVQLVAEVISTDKWFQALGQPVWGRPYLTALQSPTSPFVDFSPAETVSEAEWHQPLSEPVRTRWLAIAQHPAAVISPWALTQPEAVHLQWLNALSEPNRPRQTPPNVQAPVFPVEVVTLDKWQAHWQQPVRVRVTPQVQQPVLAAVEFVAAYRWLQPWSEMVRQPRRTQADLASVLFVAPRVNPDSYYIPLSEPVRVRWFDPAKQMAGTSAALLISNVFEITLGRYIVLDSRPSTITLANRKLV